MSRTEIQQSSHSLDRRTLPSANISSSPIVVTTVRTIHCTLCFAVALASLITSDVQAQQSRAYPNSVRSTEQVARAKWTPNREAAEANPNLDLIPAPVRAAQTTNRSSNQRVIRNGHGQRAVQTRTPSSRTTRQQPNTRVRQTAARQPARPSGVRQAQHVVHGGSLPAPTMTAGTVINGPIVDGGYVDGGYVDGGYIEGDIVHENYPLDGHVGCDASPIGASCGCDAGGCDSIGGCGGGCTTSCGGNCSMCGELASGQAWRPAITLRLPTDGWVSLEALNWWQDGMRLPPLVTTSQNGTARGDAGVLGRPTTSHFIRR